MKRWDRFARSNFMIKLRNWEYWPFGVVQFPIFFYYPVLALRARSLTFFSGANPGITMGGMFGESKSAVLDLIPPQYKPISVLIEAGAGISKALQVMALSNLHFPVVCKPDIGERGFMVRRVKNENGLANYIKEMPNDFIIQELVDLPLEFGVFYQRLPQDVSGQVTSIVMKEMLSVVGDGSSTLENLILAQDRAKLQWEKLQRVYASELQHVIPLGKKIEIVSIGNHCLGTKFINANHLISTKLSASFDKISKQIPGFYFGRYDLRCRTINDLEEGRVKIMELNGCGAEPAHIYDPNFSFFSAIGVLFRHWNMIFSIAEQNRRAGLSYLPLKEAVQYYRSFKSKIR